MQRDELKLKALFTDLAKTTICGVKVGTGPAATHLVGLVMQQLDRDITIKDVITYVEILIKKPLELLSNSEKSLLITMGLLQIQKPKPFTSLTDAGRNDPCPCGSGEKFKRCCLGLVNSYERGLRCGHKDKKLA